MMQLVGYVAPIVMIFVGIGLASWALLIISAQADQRQDEIESHQAMRRALSDDHTIRRHRERWW